MPQNIWWWQSSRILKQSYRDFELIVVDDGSSDESPALLRSFAINDSRVQIIEQKNSGIVVALNRAAASARGKYLARMDADDYSHPDRFAAQVAALEQNSEIVALDCCHLLVDDCGRILKNFTNPAVGPDLAILPRSNLFVPQPQAAFLCHPAVIMRRDAFERVGGYRDAFRFAEDLDLWLRLEEIGSLARVRKGLFEWRRHSQRTSVTKLIPQIQRHVGAVVCAQMRRSGQSDDFVSKLPFETFNYEVFGNTAIQKFCDDYEAALLFERPLYNQSVRYDHKTASRYFKTNIRFPQRRWRRNGKGRPLNYENQSLHLTRRLVRHYVQAGDVKALAKLGLLFLKHAQDLPRNMRGAGRIQRFLGAKEPWPRTPRLPLQDIDVVKAGLLQATYCLRFHSNANHFDHAHQTFHFLQNWPLVYAECSKNACTTMKHALFYLDTLNQPYFHDLLADHVHSKQRTGFLGRLDMDDDLFVERLISGDVLRVCIKRNPYERLYSAWYRQNSGRPTAETYKR